MTTTQDITSFEIRSKDEVRPGDLLLVTQIPGEPLGKLMEQLDGTRFSHSGIAVRRDGRRDLPATHLASALAKTLPSAVDFGGIRWDEFTTFWPSRDLYCIPMADELRPKALDYLGPFKPEYDREGAFSFVKLVTVAAGLRSVELHATDPALGERIYVACRDVAKAWNASPLSPSWYCAELVANAYGLSFTRADLAPPVGEGSGIDEEVEEPRLIGWLVRMLADEIDGIDSPRGRAWARLLAVLSTEDPGFIVRAVSDIARSGGIAVGELLDDWLDNLLSRKDEPEEAAVPEPLGAPRPMPGLENPTSRLPHALVTPRMLWAAFGRDELFRVKQEAAEAR